MKKTIYTIALLVMLLPQLSSCNQDMLDIEQPGVNELDEYYANATDEEATALAYQLYHFVKNSLTWQIPVHLLNDNTCDVYPGGGSLSDAGAANLIFKGLFDSNNWYTTSMYQYLYTLIYRSNCIIDKMDDNSEVKKRVKAEAKCFRAWAHAWAIMVYGTPPFVPHVQSADEYYPSNGDPAEMWPWILQQYDEALPDLPMKTALGGQEAIGGRWSQGAAMAFKGKAQMWSGDYPGAAKTLKDVINGVYGPYELWQGVADPSDPNVDAANPYTTLFRPYADFCDEFLLELNANNDDGATYDQTSVNTLWQYIGSRAALISAPDCIASVSYGQHMPTKHWVEDFIEYEMANAPAGKEAEYAANFGGPRRRAYVCTWDEWRDLGFNIVSTLPECDGYFIRKWMNWRADVNEVALANNKLYCNYTNFPMLRLAEVYLLYAEATLQQGSQEGLEALNAVRRRAGLKELGSYTLEDIENEKRFELYLEWGSRWIDVNRRWNLAADRFAKSEQYIPMASSTEPEGYDWFVPKYGATKGGIYIYDSGTGSPDYGWKEGHHNLFPFPETEIAVNRNLKQNLDW